MDRVRCGDGWLGMRMGRVLRIDGVRGGYGYEWARGKVIGLGLGLDMV